MLLIAFGIRIMVFICVYGIVGRLENDWSGYDVSNVLKPQVACMNKVCKTFLLSENGSKSFNLIKWVTGVEKIRVFMTWAIFGCFPYSHCAPKYSWNWLRESTNSRKNNLRWSMLAVLEI